MNESLKILYKRLLGRPAYTVYEVSETTKGHYHIGVSLPYHALADSFYLWTPGVPPNRYSWEDPIKRIIYSNVNIQGFIE